jgi:adenine-specific DNA-methyltransferase
MAGRKTRLELTWIGKDERPRLEPRILLEDPELSYHADKRVSDDDIFDNMLIHGDNLLALKALEQDYAGKVKCVFIDPPYNTGSAFKHYDDGLEHSIWLSLMRERVSALHTLLSEDGSLWITLDDNEMAYCKVMCDEVFGRQNFVATLAWQKKVSPANDALWFSGDHDHVLVFAKNKSVWRPNRFAKTAKQTKYYKNPDNDPRGPWNSAAYTCAKTADERPNLYYPIKQPNTCEDVWPKRNRVWAFGKETHQKNVELGLVYWGKDGKSTKPRIKKFLKGSKKVVPRSVWSYDDAGHTQEARLEMLSLFPDDPFATPKPERLLHRILTAATEPGDLVLDSFAGSGTTAAVAQKMNRRWIAIELGEQARTHIQLRLRRVVDGADGIGVSAVTKWTGGGGFRFYRLAPSLLERDKWNNWVVSKAYNGPMLAEALCKLHGFDYAPDPDTFWLHGRSTETDFLYVTDQNLSADQLQFISDQVGPERSLLICCRAWRAKAKDYDNLTLQKIPQAVLSKCEWGRDDYSLNVQELTPDVAAAHPGADDSQPKRNKRKPAVQELPLFAGLAKGGDQ